MKKIKTFEDARKALGIDPAMLQQYPADVQAFKKLTLVAEALNEGWKPDWSDDDQAKYYPWFEYQGSGFSFYYVSSYSAHSFLGSRLCFRSRELAEYAGRQFLELYNEYFSI